MQCHVHRITDSSGDDTRAPWKDWKPHPDSPDEKPWYQWLNAYDEKVNPNINGGKKTLTLSKEERGRGEQHPTRKRSSSTGTVVEGG